MPKKPTKATTAQRFSIPEWMRKKGYIPAGTGLAYDQVKKKYIGFSHRGYCAFGIGDKLFDPNYAPKGVDMDKLPFVKHGKVTIANLQQAKLAAKRFADYIS